MSFKDLGLSPETLKAIDEVGYEKPTPIQEQAIPMVLMCRDVLGLAQTGTGKTGAFTIPMIDILAGGRAKARMPRSLILTPTRELAAQISDNFVQYGKYHPLTQALIVGGTSMDDQIRKLERGVDVLIATPGRLLDLFDRGKILLPDIKILVIDEADRMLDMGFIPDLERIVSILPPIRQTLFFSATMPGPIKKLADKYLSNPKTVSVSQQSSTAENVEHFVVHTHPKKKAESFGALIKQETVKNGFIFCNRKKDIRDVCNIVKKLGHTAEPMHGDMEQEERTEVLKRFKSDDVKFLVCSDVAARGLDVQGVSHVFNWDVPFNAEDYVHRIGRTGRAGMKGRAFTFATANEDKQLANVHKLIGKDIPVLDVGVGGASKPADKKDKEKPKSNSKTKKKPDGDKKRNEKPARDSAKKSEKTPRPSHQDDSDVLGFGDEMPGFFKAKK